MRLVDVLAIARSRRRTSHCYLQQPTARYLPKQAWCRSATRPAWFQRVLPAWLRPDRADCTRHGLSHRSVGTTAAKGVSRRQRVRWPGGRHRRWAGRECRWPLLHSRWPTFLRSDLPSWLCPTASLVPPVTMLDLLQRRLRIGRGQDMLDGSRVLHPAPSVPTNGSSRDKPHVEGRVRDMIDGSSV